MWTHTVHSKGSYKTPERRGNTRKNNDDTKRPVPTCRMTGGVYVGKKGPQGFLLPCIRVQESKEVPTSSSVCKHARCRQNLRRWFDPVLYLLRRYRAGAHCTRPDCHWHLPEHSICLIGMWYSWQCSTQRQAAEARRWHTLHCTPLSEAYRLSGSKGSSPGYW